MWQATFLPEVYESGIRYWLAEHASCSTGLVPSHEIPDAARYTVAEGIERAKAAAGRGEVMEPQVTLVYETGAQRCFKLADPYSVSATDETSLLKAETLRAHVRMTVGHATSVVAAVIHEARQVPGSSSGDVPLVSTHTIVTRSFAELHGLTLLPARGGVYQVWDPVVTPLRNSYSPAAGLLQSSHISPAFPPEMGGDRSGRFQ
ncbi:MAG TPA: hypothetical protein VGR37_10030 [Longimicrobiaceae bacterium]|nr:hypothetical protein [Longimicrobiaceae bacterium]